MGAGIGGMIQEKRDQISNGWALADAAVQWLSAIHDRLGHLVDLTKESQEREQYHRFVQKVTTDAATGIADVMFPGHQGFHYKLRSIAIYSAATEAGQVLTFLNGPHPAGFLHALGMSQFTSQAYPEGTVIPQGVGLDIQIRSTLLSQEVYVSVLAEKLITVEPIVTTGGGEE